MTDDLITRAERSTWQRLIDRAAHSPKGEKRKREQELRDWVHRMMRQHARRKKKAA